MKLIKILTDVRISDDRLIITVFQDDVAILSISCDTEDFPNEKEADWIATGPALSVFSAIKRLIDDEVACGEND